MIYDGSCHCGSVRFSVETGLESLIRCNCSFCKRRGAVVQIVEASNFNLLAGDTELSQYGNRPFAKHNFCKTCGIQVFSNIQGKDGQKVGFNIGCLKDVNIDVLTIKPFDGLNLL